MEILHEPNPILRKKAKKIKNPLDKEIQELIPQMIETMRAAKGLGLAAPQIGKSIRLCVIEESGILYVLINPQIKSTSMEKIITEEGCLSVPGKWIPIERSDEIKVRYLNEKGEKCKIKARGLLARAFQHEIDHLNGILIIDKKQK
ncbi:MAG: Peptide deformylase [Candidatus Moranbacteria bacterium GW2011_GWE2_35_2-]|nr:MAG: Peptide deformylase [Candidatus Moranbacteria bacterium GW2011_GWE2_35_2-]KKQ06430.1 MAG: Peptide deformylase [Candidatus Moranbacteria bacterium GW2011_GWF1_36_4]KKQ22893.1 MAG: Peptide deformylase [Candidatus Moranbacteria bacterium GW2011_GWF2_37_11]KKQ29251.1 MAG: Peptide deformylase [Candidatus Moranbacteria bacterium GW2011_GWD1_37_17]KKQ30876.1 MAG: Peptide deformylase [Candidatus Moranbacteria bacterium GW2011_GWE1_37_24]KKQ47314.1 MAG: Peptide deformylase [Candidatus Moranbact